MNRDKQLGSIRLEDVLEKRRLDQALNAKEFAVLAGVSYSTAREWFRISGFPVFRGVVFWQDFVQWRTSQNGTTNAAEKFKQPNSVSGVTPSNLPPRAARLLLEA
jgi:hypothetical protein